VDRLRVVTASARSAASSALADLPKRASSFVSPGGLAPTRRIKPPGRARWRGRQPAPRVRAHSHPHPLRSPPTDRREPADQGTSSPRAGAGPPSDPVPCSRSSATTSSRRPHGPSWI